MKYKTNPLFSVRTSAIAISLVLLGGCSTLRSDFEPPELAIPAQWQQRGSMSQATIDP